MFKTLLLLLLTTMSVHADILKSSLSYDNSFTNSLVYHWTLDNDRISTTNILNQVTGASGISVNNPSPVSGNYGNGLSFNGVNQYLRSTQVLDYAQLTISAWIKLTNYPSQKGLVAGFVNGIGNNMHDKDLVVGTDGKPYMYTWPNTPVTTSTPANALPLNTWVNIVGVCDAVGSKVYVNGLLVGSANSTPVTAGYTVPSFFVQGATGSPTFGGGYMSCSIDDVRLYSRALSNDEIQNLYLKRYKSKYGLVLQGDQFKPTDIPNLALWLDSSDQTTMYDSAIGGNLSTNNGVVGRWMDKSGNGNHATNGVVANMPKRSDGARNGRTGIVFDTTDFYSMQKTASFGATSTVFYALNTKTDINYVPILTNPQGIGFIGYGARDSGNPSYNSVGTPLVLLRGEQSYNNTAGRVYLNGLNTAVFYSVVGVVWHVSSSKLYISGYTPDSYNLVGDFYDIIIYNRVLSSTERIKVEKYLSAKWQIPLNNIISSDSTMDAIRKTSVPVSAVYVGNKLVYKTGNRNYLKDTTNPMYAYAQPENMIGFWHSKHSGGLGVQLSNSSINRNKWVDLSGKTTGIALSSFDWSASSGWGALGELTFDGLKGVATGTISGLTTNCTVLVVFKSNSTGQNVLETSANFNNNNGAILISAGTNAIGSYMKVVGGVYTGVEVLLTCDRFVTRILSNGITDYDYFCPKY